MSKKGSEIGQKKGVEHRIYLNDEDREYDVLVNPKNHLKQGKLYSDFCVLNQEFLKYVMSCGLTAKEYNILMFLIAYMDNRNRIIIDAEMIEYHLGINCTHVNKYIKKLTDKKIIIKRNLGYKKGQEVLLNFDIINPNMSFKDKATFDNVSHHKSLMSQHEAYTKQYNIQGNLDYVNTETGEVFHTKLI